MRPAFFAKGKPVDAQQHDQMLQKMRNAPGFVAARYQSGESTPKALGLYGVGGSLSHISGPSQRPILGPPSG